MKKAVWGLVSTVGGQAESEEEKIKRLEALVEDNDEKEDENEKSLSKEEDKKEIQATNCFAQTGIIRSNKVMDYPTFTKYLFLF